MHISKLGVVAATVVATTLTGLPALALGTADEHGIATTSSNDGTDASTRLAATKLEVCQHREKTIDNTMARIADRGQKQLDLFTTIANRVETFYTNHGKTLSNYDALVADVNVKKASATVAVQAVKTVGDNFSCTGPNPPGVSLAFKEALKLEISALKDYRTSVKNLIVGVKSVQGTTSSSTNSGGNQ